MADNRSAPTERSPLRDVGETGAIVYHTSAPTEPSEQAAGDLERLADRLAVVATRGSAGDTLADVSRKIAGVLREVAALREPASGPAGEPGELLPCPFCGAQPNCWDDGSADGPSYWSVTCSACPAMLDTYFADGPPGEAAGRTAAIAAWNRRTAGRAPSRTGDTRAMIADLQSTVRHPSQLDDDESMDDAIARIVRHHMEGR